MDWMDGLDPLRSLVPLEHLAVLIITPPSLKEQLQAEMTFQPILQLCLGSDGLSAKPLSTKLRSCCYRERQNVRVYRAG